MRPIGWIAAAAVVLAAVLGLLAVGYEVLSLGSSLTRVVRELRASPLAPPPRRLPAPQEPGTAPAAPGETRELRVRFALSEDDLARLLRRQDRWLGGVIGIDREVTCRLDDGRVAIATRNTVRLGGAALVSYAGRTEWALAALPRGVGVRLDALRLAGVPVPGAPWLLRRLGPREGGWTVVPTGARRRVERVDVDDGKLSVSGTVRERA